MIGDRLRQARLAAGLTLDDLANELTSQSVPITKAALSKYELSKSTPTAHLLLSAGRILGVRAAFFFEEPGVRVEWIAFRKHSALPVKRQGQVKAYAASVAEGQMWLERTLHPGDKPVLPMLAPVRGAEDAEQAAQRLRESWKLGDAPIDSVTQAAETHGCIVVGWSQDDGQFDGLSGWVNDDVPLAVVNTQVPDDRRRYNLAHELGHMVLRSSGDHADEEAFAHRFAAAFLVPANVARQELGTKRRHLSMPELGLLKRAYGLSMQAWIRRARDLEIIDERSYAGLCREFSRRRWRKSEPVEFRGSETPMRLEQLALHALAEGIVSPSEARRLSPESLLIDGMEKEKESPTGASVLLGLPENERDMVLRLAAAEAAETYETDPNLTDFEAFGEDDLHV